jgi:cholesterol oxidase
MDKTEQFDAVIIGSGFGGSVMAYRLSEAGRSVCVLERGRAYPPGSFARTPHQCENAFWDPSAGLHGLFDIWSFQRGISAVVSAGLGGGSLIYANVLIRKDPKWFVQENHQTGTYTPWPVSYNDLEPHYAEVEKILKPQRYPIGFEPYRHTPKTRAFKEAADKLRSENPEVQWFLPNLAVTFANEGADPIPGELIREAFPNIHNRQRNTCRLCGECDIGCNFGSKNTLDYTYLTLAKQAKAEIRTLCEVRTFHLHPDGGYEVSYVEHKFDESMESQPQNTKTLPLTTVRAKKLILASGTLGSTYLLLKNRSEFPSLSSALGSKFSGNGDYLAIAFECRQSAPGGTKSKYVDASVGPVITSTIRVDDRVDGGSGPGLYMQDAGFPALLGWGVEAGQMPGVLLRALEYSFHRLKAWWENDSRSEVSDQIRDLIGLCEVSGSSLPLLGMGRDEPDGRLWLADAKNQKLLEAEFPLRDSSAYLDRVKSIARAMTDALGGTFKENPVTEFLKRLITVHPLGGCPMGLNAIQGVVDPFCQVHGYPGFCIADGSVMPGPVGPNPSLTIAALADRGAEHLLQNW